MVKLRLFNLYPICI